MGGGCAGLGGGTRQIQTTPTLHSYKRQTQIVRIVRRTQAHKKSEDETCMTSCAGHGADMRDV